MINRKLLSFLTSFLVLVLLSITNCNQVLAKPMQNLKFSIIQELKHQGICDASAAVPLGQDRFIVGNDEADKELGNMLRVYNSKASGNLLKVMDINDYFDNNPKHKEIDLEAVSELDGVIYWITSHGRNKDAEQKLPRHQFFANKITEDQLSVKQEGKSYTQIVLRDMLEDPKFAQLSLKTAETIAPKKPGGLNIEGLTVTPEKELLIGFRNPIPQGKALLIPLKNPSDLIAKNMNVKAIFGDPILLDLEGFGIRSIEYWSVIDSYLIIAGQFDQGENFALYSWSGKKEDKPSRITIDFPKGFRPESILFYPHLKDQFQILSDDGAIVRANGQKCKDIPEKDNPEKFFRSVWVKVN